MINFADPFVILALNKNQCSPGLMGTAKTLADAEEIRDRAIRAGWLLVMIRAGSKG